MKTLISLIPDTDSAEHAVGKLRQAGVSQDKMCILCRPVEVWKRLGGDEKLHIVIRYGLYGTLLGLAVGLLYGVPSGIMNCLVMDCAVNTNLTFLAIITLFWILGGAFLGTLFGLDRLEKDLYSYVEGVRRGGAFIMVDIPENQAAAVTKILKEEHGLLVHKLKNE
jgi:hypothetical protein